MKRSLLLILVLAMSFSLFNSCRKDHANEQYTGTITAPTKANLGVTVTASVNGFVTDENNHAVVGATVTAGSLTALTDSFGYFKIKNTSLSQLAGFVQVVYPGYFTGYKTFICTASKAMFTRVKLLPKINAGSVTASAGGTVTNTNGGIVTLPANGVVVAAGNAAYSGNVHLAISWIDPTNINAITLNMPGDLRGIDSANNIQGLNSYGMLAVELTGDAGQLLQIASGKQATLSFPIPSALLASAPAIIPLWSFNDTTGLWKEEGYATKVGTNYVGAVAHFSYWNCDIPFGAGVVFQAQLVDSTLHPLANTTVEIISQTGAYTGCHGFTDSTGYICGLVPANSNLQLNCLVTPCYSNLFSKNFSTASANIDLGTLIPISNQNQQVYIIDGTAVDCSNAPVNNGGVLLIPNDNSGNIYAPVINGNFHITTYSCNTSVTYSIVGSNYVNQPAQYGSVQALSVIPGFNNVGKISTCEAVDTQDTGYIKYYIDNILVTYVVDRRSVNGGMCMGWFTDSSTNVQYIGEVAGPAISSTFTTDVPLGATGTYNVTYINIEGTNNGVVNTAAVYEDLIWNVPNYPLTPITVIITEYGPETTGFIAGTMSGTIYNYSDTTIHQFSGDFRVRRY
jgi:hypothetical protein